MLEAVPAEWLGPGMRYGLGVMIGDTPLGELRRHDGVFPGYATTMGYFVEHGLGAALQINTEDANGLGRPLSRVLIELAQIVVDEG